jgi:hypothetical protein
MVSAAIADVEIFLREGPKRRQPKTNCPLQRRSLTRSPPSKGGARGGRNVTVGGQHRFDASLYRAPVERLTSARDSRPRRDPDRRSQPDRRSPAPLYRRLRTPSPFKRKARGSRRD